MVVVSGDTAGWLTPCGCTSNQSGGLLRRGTYLADLRRSADVLYIDAGGAAGGSSPYHLAKFEAILKGERAMGLAAHNLGASELALGPDRLREIATRHDVPLISANTTDLSGKPIVPGKVKTTVAGTEMVVIGVVSPALAPRGIKATDPRQAILDALASAGPRGGSVIVLAYAPEDELQSLASSLPEVDAIVGGPTGQAVTPRRAGPVVIASATNKGKFLVRLERESSDWWTGNVVEMGPTFADAPEQRQNLSAFLDGLKAKDFSAAETGLVPPLPAGSPADYRLAGTASCTRCHVAEQSAWSASAHAHAFQTIRDKGFHVDPSCQSCHTTGYGLPGGFDRLATSMSVVDVGCESCHGPSAFHAAQPTRRTPWTASEQCVQCHDHENSPNFEFGSYWSRIAHGKHAQPQGVRP